MADQLPSSTDPIDGEDTTALGYLAKLRTVMDAVEDDIIWIMNRVGRIEHRLDGHIADGEQNPDPEPEPEPEELAVNVIAEPAGNGSVVVEWSTNLPGEVAGWYVERDGVDTSGHGAWGTELPATTRTQQFNLLVPGDTYTFTVIEQGTGVTATAQLVVPGTPEPDPEPDPGEDPGTGTGTTAAERHGWGAPVWVDEFDQDGPPDPAKWNNAPEAGMPGHAGNGRRIASSTYVQNGKMVLHGRSNGDTGWCRQNLRTRYGRWELRMRSENLGSSGSMYHVLALIWPTSERWPGDGEYDWVEVFDPDANKLAAFLHYPHPSMPVQQEYAETPADMNQWQNVAFEWAPDGLTGFLNGEVWFRFANGAGPGGRRNIQDMPEGYLTLQLDNFHGSGMREAIMEVDWVRFYDL